MSFIHETPVTALIVEPGKPSRVEVVSYKDAQRLVGALATIHLPGRVKVLCHMETLFQSWMVPNRKVPQGVERLAGKTMSGTFIVLGSGGTRGEQDRSLTAQEQAKWQAHFDSAEAQP